VIDLKLPSLAQAPDDVTSEPKLTPASVSHSNLKLKKQETSESQHFPKTARNRDRLRNLDGTTMNVQDYLEMVNALKKGLVDDKNQGPAILGFGIRNTELEKFKVQE
jgi:hypothetical protein